MLRTFARKLVLTLTRLPLLRCESSVDDVRADDDVDDVVIIVDVFRRLSSLTSSILNPEAFISKVFVTSLRVNQRSSWSGVCACATVTSLTLEEVEQMLSRNAPFASMTSSLVGNFKLQVLVSNSAGVSSAVALTSFNDVTGDFDVSASMQCKLSMLLAFVRSTSDVTLRSLSSCSSNSNNEI